MLSVAMLRRHGRLPAQLIFCSLAWLAACSLLAPQFTRPQVSVVSIQLVGGNFLQQNFLVKLNIQNPNDRPLPVNGLHVELNVAGQRLASGVSNQPFVVPAHGENQFDMTVRASMALALLTLSQSNSTSRTIDYDMTGGASLDLPFLRELPFKQQGSFAIPR